MAQRFVEGVAYLFQIFSHRHVVNLQAKRKGVDKHTHRIGNLQIRTAAANRREIHLAVVGIARDDVTRCSKIKVSWRDFLLTAEGRSFVQIRWAHSLADKALLVALGQVGRNLARPFAGLQFFCKELLGSLKRIAVFSLLLVADKVEIGVGFFLDG